MQSLGDEYSSWDRKQSSDRQSDATTQKEASKERSAHKPVKTQKRMKKKSDNYIVLNSPPVYKADEYDKKLSKIMTGFTSNTAEKKMYSSG